MRWQLGQHEGTRAHSGNAGLTLHEALDMAGAVDAQRSGRSREAFRATRTGRAVVLALALAVVGGCASSGPVADQTTSSATADSTTPLSTSEPETTDTPEQPAAGGGGVAIELAGLPVGGGGATSDGQAWCQVLFWGKQLPAGVSLQIDAVKIFEQGAQLRPDGCANVPPCQGMVIGPDDSQSCAVLVQPSTPETPFLTGALDGILNCPDQQTCDAVGATDGSKFRIDNPGGGSADNGDATGGTTEPSANAGTDGEPGPTTNS